jgi:hypothetical protein
LTPSITSTPTITLSPTATSTLNATSVVVGLPYPNPVRGAGPLSIDVQAPPGTALTWDVFTVAFRKIAGGSMTVNETATVSWDLSHSGGNPLANGLYYIRIKASAGNGTAVKVLKVLLLR